MGKYGIVIRRTRRCLRGHTHHRADLNVVISELIGELGVPSSGDDHNSFVRYVQVKEEHAEKAKHDILIIWTDYFKPEHLAAHPQLHTKVWEACKLGSYVKQHVDMAKAEEFKAALEEIGAAFTATKS